MSESVLHWASSYIGKPWISGAQGPDAFNCWGLVRWVERVHYGRILPEIPVDEDLRDEVVKAIRDTIVTGAWGRVKIPSDGDTVVLRSTSDPLHVGVWLDVNNGGVLHCARRLGVIFSTPLALQLCGWSHMEFYRCAQ